MKGKMKGKIQVIIGVVVVAILAFVIISNQPKATKSAKSKTKSPAPNQNAKPWLDQRGRFYTDEARVEERFTLIDANTIHWQATIDDSNVYTDPFTIALAYRRSTVEDFEIWEEACFENNDLSAEMFMNVGYKIYPGITGDEARRLKAAWELEEEER